MIQVEPNYIAYTEMKQKHRKVKRLHATPTKQNDIEWPHGFFKLLFFFLFCWFATPRLDQRIMVNSMDDLTTQWFFPIYTEISMMLEISGYMDHFLWNLPATNGR